MEDLPYTVYKINLWPLTIGDFTLGNALFYPVELVKNSDKSKYKYLGYGIGLDNHGIFHFLLGDLVKM